MKTQAIAAILAPALTLSLALSACSESQTRQPAPAPDAASTPAATPAEQPDAAATAPPGDAPAPLPTPREEVPPTAAPPVDPVAPPQTVEEIIPPPANPAAAPPATPRDADQPEQVIETIETDSGLIIEILRVGDGEVVRPGDTIIVHYHGTLGDGRVFDSSVERGEPARLGLFGVIRGWQEGIPGMKVGGKRRLIIPPELGYGARARPNIPANSMLIFEIEVFDIVR